MPWARGCILERSLDLVKADFGLDGVQQGSTGLYRLYGIEAFATGRPDAEDRSSTVTPAIVRVNDRQLPTTRAAIGEPSTRRKITSTSSRGRRLAFDRERPPGPPPVAASELGVGAGRRGWASGLGVGAGRRSWASGLGVGAGRCPRRWPSTAEARFRRVALQRIGLLVLPVGSARGGLPD